MKKIHPELQRGIESAKTQPTVVRSGFAKYAGKPRAPFWKNHTAWRSNEYETGETFHSRDFGLFCIDVTPSAGVWEVSACETSGDRWTIVKLPRKYKTPKEAKAAGDKFAAKIFREASQSVKVGK